MDYSTSDYDRVPDLETTLEFDLNPDPRTPCVLVLDTSGSMGGGPLAVLNAGLQIFQQELRADPLARRRVEVAVVTFGGTVRVLQDFVSAEQFVAPTLAASGGTPLGEAVERALDRVGLRKHVYQEHGVPYTRPWVFLMTDGQPTDAWEAAAARVQRASAAKQVALYAVGVQGADLGTLARFAVAERPPLALAGLKFRELFVWLSRSLGQVSQSKAGQQAALPSPGTWAAGWTTA